MSFVAISTFRHLSMEMLRDDMSKKADEHLTKLVVLSGQAALQMYRCGGQTAYDNYVGGLLDSAGVRISLLGPDNRTIKGEPAPVAAVQMATEARSTHQTALDRSPSSLTVAKELSSDANEALVVVGTHTFGPPPGMFPPGGKEPPFLTGLLPPFFSQGEIIRTAVMLLVIALVCYLLARSLTTPIRRLQKITQQIAGGDYSARVGGSLGRGGNEIADLGRDFDIMVERTEKVITSQNRLLRDISHELRSPLARLVVALELAKKCCPEEEDTALSKIGQEAARIDDLIGHLLTLTRLESGAGILAVEVVDLTELVRSIAADVNFEAADSHKGVTIVAAATVRLSGSRELLRRAIENIVRNAAHYTAANTRVEISLAVSKAEATITVSDYGPGVPESDLPHLFQPFYRVAKARERQSGGVGIGLAIALQAVKAHGGAITAKNLSERQGLVVTITLPYAIC